MLTCLPFPSAHDHDHAGERCRTGRCTICFELEPSLEETYFRTMQDMLLEPSRVRSGWQQHDDESVFAAGLHTAFAHPLRDCSAVWRIAEN